MALFRIAFGLVATGWTISLIPYLFAFYGPAGILPRAPSDSVADWSLLQISDSSALLVAIFAATLAAAVATTLGFYTRIATVVLWIGIMSFTHRDTFATNSGDGVVRILALFLMFAPAGAALSIDRIRKAPGGFWSFPMRAPWALRLVQIQISIGYISAVWHKARNPLWSNGTAVSYALRMDDIHRLATPAFVTHSVLLINLMTYGALAVELSLGVLVWNRAARPYVLVLGVLLHLGIDSSIMVGFFSYAMLASYLTFVPPETATRWILATRDLLAHAASQRFWVGKRNSSVAVPHALAGQSFLPQRPLLLRRQPDLSKVAGGRDRRSQRTAGTGVQSSPVDGLAQNRHTTSRA